MLPFSDIDFFLFALMYVGVFWALKFILKNKYYSWITFFITAFYLAFYYKYSFASFGFFAFSFLYVRFLAPLVNHGLISAIILAAPLALLKLHLNPSFIYFAGLSFVTFRSIQVSLDYKAGETINPIHYFNFLFFIPTLLIGPLDRFKRFTENSEKGFEHINQLQILEGWQEFMKGVLYKFVLAEFISRYWLEGYKIESNVPLQFLNDMYSYTFYLFFDFAGYSAMACGMAKMVGINLPMNFNSPFLAINPTDFWQRWHASLTNWLTDYVFKPFYKFLSGKKSLKKFPITKQNSAIFLTLFIMGCWNGFELNFIFSGLIYGTYSVIYNIYLIKCRQADHDVFFGNLSPAFVKYFSIFIMFNLVCFALHVFSGR